MNLSDYLTAKGERPHRQNSDPWFAAHADVLAQVDAALRDGYGVPAIHDWLVTHHGFPFGSATLERRKKVLRGTARLPD